MCLSLFVLQSNELLNGNCSPPETLALARARQKQRILRPLVLGTLFRASSFRTRGARRNERKRRNFQSLRGTFASSTKYLRQSSWPNFAAIATQSIFTSSDIFLSSTKYFKMSMRPILLLVLPLLCPSLAKVSLCRKEIEHSRGVLHEQLVHTTSFSSHGQPFEKQYFNISRLPLSAAVLIVSSSHSQCFTSLAHLRNSSLFVPATACKTRLDLSLSIFIFLSPGHVIPRPFQRRNG